MINRIKSFSIKRTLKYSIIFLIMISVAVFTGCKGKTDEHGHAADTHTESGEKEGEHEHSEGDGHDHSKHEKETKHAEGDGHDHGSEHTETNKK